MYFDGPPREPRRSRGRLFALAVGAFAATAIGLTLGLRGVDSPESAAAAQPPAQAAEPAHAHSTQPATTGQTATAEVPAAPKNTMSADAPAYRPARVQQVHFDMTEKTVEIAPGKVVKVWTFGDTVPGPVVRVRVGDTVEASITNKTQMPHSIDFHAARIAPDKAFRDVAPGETFEFSFKATSPGVFMYHCGTAPVVHHIANGMYGMIIVEPEEGLPPVDRELAFVQSDFYVSDTPGAPADNEKLMSGIPDVVAFNGYAGQYKDQPITVKAGERIRAFVLAAGPNTWSAFHVVGTIFDRAWIDGIHPENLSLGNQTLNLSASQGAVAEFRLDQEGTYPFVTHDFTNAAKGAVGLLRTEGATGTMSH
jgi:nitrite reductase (NO-forming)